MLVGSLHTQDNCLTPRASPCILRIYGDVTGPGRRIKFLRPTAFGILFGARALSRHHIFFVYSENHSQCDNYLIKFILQQIINFLALELYRFGEKKLV